MTSSSRYDRPYKSFHAARETAVFASCPAVGTEELSAARRTVCAVALQLAPDDPAPAAREVLDALGLHPAGRPSERSRP